MILCMMLFVIILFFVTPFTQEIKVTPKDNGCKHVSVTLWRYIERIQSEICGDEQISIFMPMMGTTTINAKHNAPKE